MVDARKEDFNFLGFTIEVRKSSRTGKEIPLIRPSKKAVKHIKANIAILRRYRCFFGPPGHEDDHNHGWYQCYCRKDTFRIEQDK